MISTPENLESIPPSDVDEVVMEFEDEFFGLVEAYADEETAYDALKLYEQNRYLSPKTVIASYIMFVRDKWPLALFEYENMFEIRDIQEQFKAEFHSDAIDVSASVMAYQDAMNNLWLEHQARWENRG